MSTACVARCCSASLMHVDVRQFGVGATPLLVEHLAEQARVSRVVLDQENRLDAIALAHLASDACCGSLTLVSQKSLMLFTRLSNASSCTGLLR